MRLVVALASIVAVPTVAEIPDEVSSAERAAQSWLTLTDAGAYAESWDAAASLFRSSITKPRWISSIRNVRGPLGGVTSRTIRSAQYTRSLPGVPRGEYVVIQFETDFDALSPAIETVTPVHEKDGSWKVGGYYIKKAPPQPAH